MSNNFYFEVKTTQDIISAVKNISPLIPETALKEMAKLKSIHIAQTNAGVKPLFQKTQYYSSMRELKAFYEKYKDILILTGEIPYTWEDMIAHFEEEQKDPRLAFRILSTSDVYRDYYTDGDGYEWCASYDFC